MTKEISVEGIGNIRLIRSARYRNLKISVRPFRGVDVSIPEKVSFTDAGKFVHMKRDWIRHNLEKMHRIESRQSVFDENTQFSTREHRLKIIPHQEKSIRIIIKKNFIYVFFPSLVTVSDLRIQAAIRKAIIEAWRLEAKKLLPRRVDELAKQNGFVYSKISVKNASTRWGSCSSSNNINLNVQLMRLPPHLCDYIILHELAHTVHKNHKAEFWKLLDKVTGRAKELDREMKKYNLKVW